MGNVSEAVKCNAPTIAGGYCTKLVLPSTGRCSAKHPRPQQNVSSPVANKKKLVSTSLAQANYAEDDAFYPEEYRLLAAEHLDEGMVVEFQGVVASVEPSADDADVLFVSLIDPAGDTKERWFRSTELVPVGDDPDRLPLVRVWNDQDRQWEQIDAKEADDSVLLEAIRHHLSVAGSLAESVSSELKQNETITDVTDRLFGGWEADYGTDPYVESEHLRLAKNLSNLLSQRHGVRSSLSV